MRVHASPIDGVDGGGEVRVAGDEDAARVGRTLGDPREELDPGEPGHALVADHEVEVRVPRELPGLLARARARHAADALEAAGEELDPPGLVVHHEDAKGPRHARSIGGSGGGD